MNNLFHKISNSEDIISINDYLPIIRMILTEKEIYILFKMNNIKQEKNIEFERDFDLLNSLEGRARFYQLKKLSLIEERSINKLREIYNINKSFIISKEDIINYYKKQITLIENNLNEIKKEEKVVSPYEYYFSVYHFSSNESDQMLEKNLNSKKKYFINKITSINTK